MDHAAAIMGMLNPGFVRACCDAMKELMTECGARVVVDFWNPFAVIAARALDIPLVTIIQADAHPGSRGFMWWEPAPENIPTVVPVVNQVLAGYGLPQVNRLEELSVGDLTMVVGTPDTDPLAPNEGVTYLGAILWQDSQAQLPKKITDLRDDKPIIWVYSGNPRYASGVNALDSFIVLQTCIGALAGEDVQVVLTTGHHPLPKEVLPLPANFLHEPYVPGLTMAEKCDLLIHHGGYGSCQTGLYAGKPAVIIPTYSERESNARRIAALGAGAVLAVDTSRREKSASVDELRNLVRRVLGDPTFSSNARRIGEQLRAHGGAAQAADLIEKLVAARRPAAQHRDSCYHGAVFSSRRQDPPMTDIHDLSAVELLARYRANRSRLPRSSPRSKSTSRAGSRISRRSIATIRKPHAPRLSPRPNAGPRARRLGRLTACR